MTHAERARAFLAEVLPASAPAAEPGALDELESALGEMVARGLAVEPSADEAETMAAIRAAVAEPGSLEEATAAVEGLHLEDLLLAGRCSRGDEGAARIFRDEYRDAIRAVAGRVRAEAVDEVESRVMARLLVPDGADTVLARYRGSGPLRAWLRVVVTREAISLVRKKERETPTDDESLFERATSVEDPELQYVKERHLGDFRAAFLQALTELTPRERNLLRYHYLHEQSLESVAALYRVHRSSVARWLASARRRLFASTREQLIERLGEGSRAFESVMELIQSQLQAGIVGAVGAVEETEVGQAPTSDDE